jgi:hypothetical protein
MLRKRQEDAEYNKTIDLLDSALGPSLLLQGHGGRVRQKKTQQKTVDILQKVGRVNEGGSAESCGN